MNKKKIMSIILASSIISATMLGKNIITKANTITKKKETIDFKDLKQHIKYRLDRFEEDLNDQNYEYSDFSIKTTQRMINSLGESETDKELKNRFNSLKQRYEKEKATGSKVGLIKRLKNQISEQINLIKEAINNNRYSEASGRIRLAEEKIKDLNKYEDASNYTNEVKNLDKVIFNKKIEEAQERTKESNIIEKMKLLESMINNKNYENADSVINQIKFNINEFNKKYKFNEDIEGKFKILEQRYLNEKHNNINKEPYEKSDGSKDNKEKKITNNISPKIKEMKEVIAKNVDTLENLLDNKDYNKAETMINRINLEKSKLKETSVERKELDKKVEQLQNRYKDEKVKIIPIKVNELKEETNNLIDNLSIQIKNKKDITEVNKTLNSVENKIEEFKNYKKVETIESTFNEIKNDIKSGKEIDSAKLIELKEQLDKSISDENNENLEEQINKDIESEAKDLLNNNSLEASNKDLLEKESNKSLAVKVGVGIGTMLLGVSAFFINKKVRRKKH